MSSTLCPCELLDLETVTSDVHEVPGRHGANVAKSAVGERKAFGCGCERIALHPVEQRAKSVRIPREDEVTSRVDERHAVGAVHLLVDSAKDLDEVSDVAIVERIREVVHQELGVGLPDEVVTLLDEVRAQLPVIREVAVETEREPLPRLPVVTLERLRVGRIVLAARRVADVTDGRLPFVFVDDRLKLGRVGVRETKHIRHAADVLVRVDELRCVAVIPRETGRELPSILQVDEHVRNHSDDLRIGQGLPRGSGEAVHSVHGRYAAFLTHRVEHGGSPPAKWGEGEREAKKVLLRPRTVKARMPPRRAAVPGWRDR